jgi:hypothetical protein
MLSPTIVSSPATRVNGRCCKCNGLVIFTNRAGVPLIRSVGLIMQDKSSRPEDGGEESLSRPANPPVCFAGLALNLDACTLARDSGEAITLTRSEFRLLRLFVTRPGRVLSRDACKIACNNDPLRGSFAPNNDPL